MQTLSTKISILVHAGKKAKLKKEYLERLQATRLSVIIAGHITFDYKSIICGLFKKIKNNDKEKLRPPLKSCQRLIKITPKL